MRQILLIIILCFTFIFIRQANAIDKDKINKELGTRITKISDTHDNIDHETTIISIKQKVEHIEEEFLQNDKNFERIVNNQKDIFTTMIYVLLAITAALLGASWFNNTYFIRMEVKKAKDDILKEFSDKIKEINLKIEKLNEARFKNIEEKYACQFNKLEGLSYNSMARVYEQSKANHTSAIWYARGLRKFIECDIVDDDWIRLQIGNTSSNLEKALSFNDPKLISELQEIINIIPEDKFKAEKDKLQKILSEKIGK